MKPKNLSIFIALAAILISLAFAERMDAPVYFSIPKGWAKPHYDFSSNAITEAKFQLGRRLFYDPIFSRDSTVSCASCHQQASAFTHIDHDLSHGIDGKIGTRNSIALMNLAWSKSFMWDGGVNHLEVQALNPITNPLEMDENLANVITKLERNPNYKRMFSGAFGSGKITGQHVLKALAQFELMLVSSNSKYDRVMRREESFSTMELNGYQLFKNNCASCHTEPLFSSDRFENNGLDRDPTLNDYGRMKISSLKRDSLKYKVPTLRNIQVTFPYMHDGRFKTLTEVIRHYNSVKSNSANLNLRPMNLSDDDRVNLLAFLKTLTDKQFLTDPRFSFPKN